MVASRCCAEATPSDSDATSRPKTPVRTKCFITDREKQNLPQNQLKSEAARLPVHGKLLFLSDLPTPHKRSAGSAGIFAGVFLHTGISPAAMPALPGVF